MTEGIAAGGRLLPANPQNAGDSRKDRLPDPLAFKSILQENPDATLAKGQAKSAREQETNEREWRLTELLEKLTVSQQDEKPATDNESEAEGKSKKADGKSAADIDTAPKLPELSGTGDEEKSLASGEEEEGKPRDQQEQGATARPLPEATPAPDKAVDSRQATAARPADTPLPATRPANLDAPEIRNEAGRSEAITRQGQAAPEPETALKMLKSGSSANENSLQQAVNDSKTRADNFLSGQGEKRGEQNPGRQSRGDDGGKQPFRVVSVQTNPAPAATLNAQTMPAGGQPAGTITGALAADPGFGAAASEAARAIATAQGSGSQTLHTLKIQLHPAELGTVTAKLSTSGEQLIVELSVETAEARQKLNADGEAMTRALRALGYEVDRVTIQQATPSNSTATNTGSAGRDTGGFAAGDSGDRHSGGNAGAKDGGHGGNGREPRREENANAQANGTLYI